MNAVEFLFALFAVFGATARWFLWLRFVYKIDRINLNINRVAEDKRKLSDDKEETITR